jgi:hypothetical protein
MFCRGRELPLVLPATVCGNGRCKQGKYDGNTVFRGISSTGIFGVRPENEVVWMDLST